MKSLIVIYLLAFVTAILGLWYMNRCIDELIAEQQPQTVYSPSMEPGR